MSDVGYRVIYAGPADGSAYAHPQVVEGNAVSAVLPGTLMEQATTGLDTQANGATFFGALPLFANKDELGTSNSVDDAWTVGENMIAIQGRSGEFLNVLIASGVSVTALGTPLASNGSGQLTVAATDGTNEIIAYADETFTALSEDTLKRVVIK